MLSRMLTRSQMALLCLGLFLALALCGAWQAFSWGRTQLDTGALVCADTLLGYGPIMAVNQHDPSVFINRGGRLPAPMQSLKN